MLNIAIIGFGPRGLSIFERFISNKLSGEIKQKLNIFIFDPMSFGSGCHHLKQFNRLLANKEFKNEG